MATNLSSASLQKLTGVSPKLVAVVKLAAQKTEADAAWGVFEGVRTLEMQKEYLRRGVTKTLASKHLEQADGFGHAVDLVPIVGGVFRWEWGAIYPIAQAMADAARELEVDLVWGGVWDKSLAQFSANQAMIVSETKAYCQRHPGPDFLDGPHYQLANGQLAT